jgi:hypothetical protein
MKFDWLGIRQYNFCDFLNKRGFKVRRELKTCSKSFDNIFTTWTGVLFGRTTEERF